MDRTVEAEVPDAVLERGPRPDKKVEMYSTHFSNRVPQKTKPTFVNEKFLELRNYEYFK